VPSYAELCPAMPGYVLLFLEKKKINRNIITEKFSKKA
jgi:hypothetical protein